MYTVRARTAWPGTTAAVDGRSTAPARSVMSGAPCRRIRRAGSLG